MVMLIFHYIAQLFLHCKQCKLRPLFPLGTPLNISNMNRTRTVKQGSLKRCVWIQQSTKKSHLTSHTCYSSQKNLHCCIAYWRMNE